MSNEIVFIDPWQLRHYAALSRPPTLNGSAAHLDRLLDHRDVLRAAEDHEAVAGLATPIAANLVELASVDSKTRRRLDRKVTVLAAHRADWADRPMVAAVIEGAVMADAQALALDRGEEMRLRARLGGAA